MKFLSLLLLGVFAFLFLGCTVVPNLSELRTPPQVGPIDLNACVNNCLRINSSAIWRMGCKIDCYSKKGIETNDSTVCRPLLYDNMGAYLRLLAIVK
ncbi:hypothetical protein HZC07_03855 [Candidatus Micrarchaeota archaeon]|nr:hypothetical protein [Candidatus Micrarchaeota archaeon]